MNGEHGEIYNRITVLETLTSEKWDAHDTRANDMRKVLEGQLKDIKDTLVFIKDRLSSLPCNVHIERLSKIDKTLLSHDKIMQRVGIAVVIAIVVGVVKSIIM